MLDRVTNSMVKDFAMKQSLTFNEDTTNEIFENFGGYCAVAKYINEDTLNIDDFATGGSADESGSDLGMNADQNNIPRHMSKKYVL